MQCTMPAGTPIIAKYHLAPNFSINPPECGGILELGSIIPNVTEADNPPLNEECHVKIPLPKLFCSHQKGFTLTREQMASGSYGVAAKMLGLEGIGGELSWARERSAEDVYTIASLDTIYFSPSPAYLRESMAKPDVADYVEGSGNEPVYMVTGLKTARGAAVRMKKDRKWTATGEVGIDLTAATGVPLELGPKVTISREKRKEMGFEESTDFIVGIRVKKLMYKRHWLLRKMRLGELAATEHNKGATLVDNDPVGKTKDDDVIDLGGDETEEGDQGDIADLGEEAVTWVLGAKDNNKREE
ncbi:hypothetical protein DER44DRAFT_56325 [Fusarium oxysporum]|nr:hypothetical protein DER44DRAFT_56325 [Fusarium oxysporum]